MVDYSVWDHIEVSDDEDDTHPNIDTASLFRWRHQARVERMEQFEKEKEELTKGANECKKKLLDCQKKLKEMEVQESAKSEAKKLQQEMEQLKKEEKKWQKKEDELKKKEKTLPWNVDTLSKEGFSKSVFNVKPENNEVSEEEKEQKHKTFVEKNVKQLKHFGMLHRWDDSQKYLSDNSHLVCEETANYLVIWCIDLEVEEKHALMEQVAHQTIVMQFILELAKSLKVDPRACFRQFFTKIKTADQQYMDAFNDELESFKGRVRERAKVRIEKALKEYEEEERKKRLGPGGLDPVEVYETLPPELQKCFDSKDIEMLKETISKMDPKFDELVAICGLDYGFPVIDLECDILILCDDYMLFYHYLLEASIYMKQCVDSGLWVPNAKDGLGADCAETEPVYEEAKTETGNQSTAS